MLYLVLGGIINICGNIEYLKPLTFAYFAFKINAFGLLYGYSYKILSLFIQ